MSRTLVIMAGGTGGHIMPGLAIAQAMRTRGWTVRWLGTSHGMENTLVPAAGIDLQTIAFSGLRGKGVWHSLVGVWRLMSGFVRSVALIRNCSADVALGMGGYVTVPGGLAAAWCRVPLVLVNSDAGLLLSNRLLLPFARRILFGLPGNMARFGPKAVWTGNPIRADIRAVAMPAERYRSRIGPLNVLVVGGSLGAAVLNRNIPLALARLPESERPHVIHQCGAAHVAAVQGIYRDLNVAAMVLPFIDDIAQRYAEADLVVCRAGAITVSELTVAGVASILVPLTASTTSHQRDNAIYLERAKAAIYLPQPELTPERLATLIASLTREQLLAMAQAARALAKPAATEGVADIVEAMMQVRA